MAPIALGVIAGAAAFLGAAFLFAATFFAATFFFGAAFLRTAFRTGFLRAGIASSLGATPPGAGSEFHDWPGWPTPTPSMRRSDDAASIPSGARGLGANGRVDPRQAGHYPPSVFVILLISLALLLPGCAGTHGKGREVPIPLSDQHERIIGSRLATRFETGVRAEPDPAINEYASQLGQRIVRLSDRPEIPYTFQV